MNPIYIHWNSATVIDSWNVPKKEFNDYIKNIIFKQPDILNDRTRFNIKMEWATHNFLYKLNILRSHTKDVDINYTLEWYFKVLYFFAGLFSWIFIK